MMTHMSRFVGAEGRFCDLLGAMSYDYREGAATAVPYPRFVRTAGPSTTLLRSSGRDDKGESGYFRKVSDLDSETAVVV